MAICYDKRKGKVILCPEKNHIILLSDEDKKIHNATIHNKIHAKRQFSVAK